MFPVFNKFPPVGASYHWIVPPGALAVKLADVPGQIETPPAVGGDGGGFMVTITGVRKLVQSFDNI